MYFKVIVTDEETRIQFTRDIRDVMVAVTMLCRSLYETKEYSKSDRAVFRQFVEEELAKLAFADVDELDKEEERRKELRDSAKAKLNADKKSLKEILKKLGDLLDEEEDEDEE